MKLVEFELINHKILKNIKIFFNIKKSFFCVLGENGSGKTLLLNEIERLYKNGITSWNDESDRSIKLFFSKNEIDKYKLPCELISIEHKKSYGKDWDSFKIYDSERGLEITNEILPIIQNPTFNDLFKYVYSTTEINFELSDIISVTASTTDSDKVLKSRSRRELGKEISQLIVDIDNQDAKMTHNFVKSNPGEIVPSFDYKLDRFKKAYKMMFDKKSLRGIIQKDNLHKIEFLDKKSNESFDISGLSSGEQQVVHRGGYLLKNLKKISGGLVLIDEPELSLHPRWQKRYIEFLGFIFKEAKKEINVQLIISTHSPYIIQTKKNILDVIILTKNNKGIIKPNKADKNWSLFFDGPSIGEINYYAFNLPSFEFHNELYGYIQEKTGNHTENKIEKYFKTKGTKQLKKWTREQNGARHSNEKYNDYDVTLQTFIRNKVHHPENKIMKSSKFSEEELKESTAQMTKLIRREAI